MDNLGQQMGELEELKKLMDQLESFSTNGNSFDSTNFDSTNFDSLNIKTKFSNSSNNPDPNYSNVGDSGH
jgi:hypothetical protein